MMPCLPVILILSEHQAHSERMSGILKQHSSLLLKAHNLEVAAKLTANQPCDLAIVDLPHVQNPISDLIRFIETHNADCLIVLDPKSQSRAEEILSQQGGQYILSSLIDQLLYMQVEQMLDTRRMRQELTAIREEIAWKYCFDRVVGISETMTTIKATAARIAATDAPFLITGEIGTGKEHLARSIHYHSKRRKNRFLPVDCTVFAPEVLEVDLFGLPGESDGRLAVVSGGTVFLDELGDLSPSIQERFLRVLNTSSESHNSDIRIIGATRYSPDDLLNKENIRVDFIKRLGLVTVHIPPLRNRLEDIAVLVEHFLAMENRAGFREAVTISTDAMEKLLSHPWPGNVRELENTVKRAVTLAQHSRMTASDVIFLVTGHTPLERGEHRVTTTLSEGTLEDSLKRRIEATLYATNWNFTQTAIKLGIGRTTLWRKIKKYDIKRLDKETISVA
ncbi:MAG: sigma-54-dependent Fis family transcriptional regulator [candidate division Zixibacteria bacterium]|nr:sigma-54-dependent Fis family transcriptional regulator [candidate division Zixibacteria bacterium]